MTPTPPDFSPYGKSRAVALAAALRGEASLLEDALEGIQSVIDELTGAFNPDTIPATIAAALAGVLAHAPDPGAPARLRGAVEALELATDAIDPGPFIPTHTITLTGVAPPHDKPREVRIVGRGAYTVGEWEAADVPDYAVDDDGNVWRWENRVSALVEPIGIDVATAARIRATSSALSAAYVDRGWDRTGLDAEDWQPSPEDVATMYAEKVPEAATVEAVRRLLRTRGPCVACARFECGHPDDVNAGKCRCGRRAGGAS